MLEAEGEVGAAAASDEEARAALRLTAGKALLKLLRLPALKAEAAIGPRL